MTAQDVLKLDSTIMLQVGASQLQKILSTMKRYKVNLEVAEEALVSKNQIIAELKADNDKLKAEIKKLQNTFITIRQVGEITGY
jgi:cell division protein FtsB